MTTKEVTLFVYAPKDPQAESWFLHGFDVSEYDWIPRKHELINVFSFFSKLWSEDLAREVEMTILLQKGYDGWMYNVEDIIHLFEVDSKRHKVNVILRPKAPISFNEE